MASHIECAEEGLTKVEKASVAVLCLDDGLDHVLWDGLGLVLFGLETRVLMSSKQHMIGTQRVRQILDSCI